MSNSLRSRINYFSRSKFVRNVLAVATGVAAAQAISLAFMPFLTRLYGPEAFGALAAFTAIINIITPLATLGYANAIVMPKTDEEANAVARLSLVSAALVSPIVLISVYVFQLQLAKLTGLEHQPNLLYLIPISLLLVALLSVANQVAIREGLFKAKSSSYVASTFIMNLGKLGAGYISATGITLIIFLIISKLINYIILMARVPKVGAFNFRHWFGLNGIQKAALDNKDFAIYRLPQSMLNAAAVGLPVILLTNYYGSSAAGYYSLTTLILGAPVLLLGQSVGEVFYPKITNAIRQQASNSLQLVIKATLALGGVAIIPFGTVILFGPDLFEFAFGEQWKTAGEYAQWIAPWLACVLATRGILAAFPILNLQSYLLVQEVFSIILRSLALIVGLKYYQSDLIAIALFSVVGIMLMLGLAIVGVKKLIKESRLW
ncbi:oligosaccharide flippase family protein [Acinetobacter schindleri]|uniref:lipopolysaccharide biosynthesis protein n=1 Tax=Acinetobacter schindleri TaxID=108981 RepID=UPI00200B0964|nr:oligosaccharide flippase family protein [Acinetobacter schindleri]MCK8641409.1 oligosaccharide flippase family protein [Acinetobacter schindleri]